MLKRARLIGLLLLLLLAFLLDITSGAIRIPFREVFHILFSSGQDTTWQFIIEKIRVPKACTAVLAGSALSVSGLQMQTLFRNPLADPSVLGITSGASLGVAMIMLAGGGMATLYAIKELGISGSWLITIAGCAGAAAVMLLVMALSGRLGDNVMVLIVGIMISSITISIISIWQYFSEPELVKDFLMWTFGSLGGVTGNQLFILWFVVGIGLIIAFLSSKMLDALLLGENYARSMGLTPQRARMIVIGSTSLLAGSVTAFCGPIGFVGIAVPHITRSLFHTSNHRVLVPGCCVIGSVLMLLCDVVSQLPGNRTILPINIITSLVGAPVVISLLLRKNKITLFG